MYLLDAVFSRCVWRIRARGASAATCLLKYDRGRNLTNAVQPPPRTPWMGPPVWIGLGHKPTDVAARVSSQPQCPCIRYYMSSRLETITADRYNRRAVGVLPAGTKCMSSSYCSCPCRKTLRISMFILLRPSRICCVMNRIIITINARLNGQFVKFVLSSQFSQISSTASKDR